MTDYGAPTAEAPMPPLEEEPKKDNRTLWIIIIVVALLLCCCCLVLAGALGWLWYNGDALIEDLNLMAPAFIV